MNSLRLLCLVLFLGCATPRDFQNAVDNHPKFEYNQAVVVNGGQKARFLGYSAYGYCYIGYWDKTGKYNESRVSVLEVSKP